MSRSSSEALNFTIEIHTCLGNGLDQVSTQICSMQASCVSIFLTVFMLFSISADVVVCVYVGVVVVAVMAAGLVSGPVWMAERHSSQLSTIFLLKSLFLVLLVVLVVWF